MNSEIAPSLDLDNRTSAHAEPYSIESILGKREVTDLSLNELDLLSHFLQREIRALDEIVRGDFTEEGLLPSTRNMLHLIATDPAIPCLTDEEEKDEEEEMLISRPSFRELATSQSVSVEIETVEDEEWTTIDYPSSSTAEDISIPLREFNFEDNAGQRDKQSLPTHRPRNFARGESLATGIHQIDNGISSPTTSSLSQASSASLTESVYAYMSAARYFERNDAQVEFQNPVLQPRVDSVAVEEISPLNSFWLLSTASSSEYNGDDEEESVESLEKSVDEFLHMLEVELQVDEESATAPERISHNTEGLEERPFTALIRPEEESSSLATNIRVEPFSEFEDGALFDSEDLVEAETEESESILAFIDRLEAELLINTSNSDNIEDAVELFVDFDGVHNFPTCVEDHQDRTLIWVQSTFLEAREDQVSRKSFSDYSGHRPSSMVSGISPMKHSKSSEPAVNGFDFAQELIQELENLQFFLASYDHLDDLDVEGLRC